MESALERYSGNTGTPDLSTFLGEEMVRNARGYHYKTDECASIRAGTFLNFLNFSFFFRFLKSKKPENFKKIKNVSARIDSERKVVLWRRGLFNTMYPP